MNLKSLNLTNIEEKVLEVIIKNKDINAKHIVELINHDKKVVYENIEKLQRKGFVSVVVKGRARHYSFSGIKSIRALIEEQERLLNLRKNESEELIQEILLVEQNVVENTNTELLIGKQTIRQFFLSLINSVNAYLVIGVPKQSEEILGRIFWENFHLKQKEKNIKAKMLFNPSLKNWVPKNENLEIKYIETEPLTETIIFQDTVAIIVWTQDPSATIIKNKTVAESYRSFFFMLWSQAKNSMNKRIIIKNK